MKRTLCAAMTVAALAVLLFGCTRPSQEKTVASLRETALKYGNYEQSGCRYEFESLKVADDMLTYVRSSACGTPAAPRSYVYTYRVALWELQPSGVSTKVDMQGVPRFYATCLPETDCVKITEQYSDDRGEGTKEYTHTLLMLSFSGEMPKGELEGFAKDFARLLEGMERI